MKKALRIGDLKHPETLRERLEGLCEWKNLTVAKGYGHEPVSAKELEAWLLKYGTPWLDYIEDTGAYLEKALAEDKSLMFEAQLGALRDIDFGIYPYTSASNTIAAYAPIGAGIPQRKLDESIGIMKANTVGIMKAYSSAVGGGPFVCEFSGDAAHAPREAGGEYGAATGRPRRVGGFDVPASRYGAKIQGCTGLALTKLDVLSIYDEIPVCVAYEMDGKATEQFPAGIVEQETAKPVYETLPGWREDISSCRKFNELPKNAQDYIRYIEKAVACPIQYVSVGPEREQYIQLY